VRADQLVEEVRHERTAVLADDVGVAGGARPLRHFHVVRIGAPQVQPVAVHQHELLVRELAAAVNQLQDTYIHVIIQIDTREQVVDVRESSGVGPRCKGGQKGGIMMSTSCVVCGRRRRTCLSCGGQKLALRWMTCLNSLLLTSLRRSWW
jgi:hypothetical protein